MNTSTQVQPHPASIDAYIRHGWSLVPIPAGTKGPRTQGWNLRKNALQTQADLPPGYGIGLAHAYSGTMALDIDNWDATVAQGIDINGYYNAADAVIIESGRPGHGKLLYRMPDGLCLPTKKIMVNSITAYELRCATANGLTVQDVLPPSIHPETNQPYRWAGNGNWTRLPLIPQPLIDLWLGMLENDKTRTIATGEVMDASWEEIGNALAHINSDCSREEWINCGMALHWAGNQTDQLDQALMLWNDWSLPSAKYPGEKVLTQQWKSFRSDKDNSVKLGTLFHLAKQSGWVRPAIDVSDLFKNTEAPKITPDELIAGLRPLPPDMDVELWPKVLCDRANQVATEIGCDPLVPLFAGLSAICGAVDARTRLELMPRFKVPPVLWLMTIGNPALKKSPASKPMFEVLTELEMSDIPRYNKEKLEWEGREAAWAASHKAYLEFSASPEALLGTDQAPMVHDLPTKPVPVRIKVSDITSQKLVREAADRPRGLICILDEMSNWIERMKNRASGEDRSAWVVSYESDRYEMDRVGSGSIRAENMAVAIYGNVQPEVFAQSKASLAADGLLQRFIPAVLRNRNWGIGQPLPDFMLNIEAWNNAVRIAYAMPVTTFKLSPEAYDVFREFQQWYADTKQDEILLHSGNTFLTAFGKLEGTVGRLTLAFHIVENPFSPTISAELLGRVIKLVRSYIIPAYRYAFDDIGGTSSFDQWVIEYIIQHADKQTVTLSEIKRSGRRQLDGVNNWVQDQWVLGAMQVLEDGKWVIRMDDGTGEHRHHAQWAIDPRLATMFADHRRSIIDAKQRQLNDIYKLSPKQKPKVYGAKVLDE